QDENLVIGAANTLLEIEKSNFFPLLNRNVEEIADHTTRNKVTLGGNICGNIFYREAVLEFLVTNSKVVIASKDGLREEHIHGMFQEMLLLEEGELLVQLKTKRNYLQLNHLSVKKRRQWDTGYPLITISAIHLQQNIHFAISGL